MGVPEGVPMLARVGAVVHRREQVPGAEQHPAAGTLGVRVRGEVRAVVVQHAQVLPVRREDLADRVPGRLQLAADPLVLGVLGAGLAEQFRLVLQRADGSRQHQPRDRVAVAVELGQDRELVQGQLLVQVLDPGPGLF